MRVVAMDPETRHRFLTAIGALDTSEAEFAGVTRHKAKPPHEQWMHGKKGPGGAVKAAVKKVAADVAGQSAALSTPTSEPTPMRRIRSGLSTVHVFDVRSDLAEAETHRQLAAAYSRAAKAITGRDSVFAVGSSPIDLDNAKEIAEGLLRAQEGFPEVRLAGWRVVTDHDRAAYAVADFPNSEIVFNSVHMADRDQMLNRGHIDMVSHYHPERSESPGTFALHEFIHLLHINALDEEVVSRRAEEAVQDGALEGLGADEISRYAEFDTRELIAEAMVDVLVNGRDAAELSKRISVIVDDEYKRKYGG